MEVQFHLGEATASSLRLSIRLIHRAVFPKEDFQHKEMLYHSITEIRRRFIWIYNEYYLPADL